MPPRARKIQINDGADRHAGRQHQDQVGGGRIGKAGAIIQHEGAICAAVDDDQLRDPPRRGFITDG